MKDNLFGMAIALVEGDSLPFGNPCGKIGSLQAFFEPQMQADKRGWTQMNGMGISLM
ncbi:hypothetical protein [Oscillatoria nigro-viridis]|uniref:hypothetical protein n=1 Tax=Phormidium nigroviride TaxID=482564 RepID=UPI0002D8E7D0|nr:hypothetical protein [Oscillatoria nigro-viridis]